MTRGGVPVDAGQIRFRPASGTKGPSADGTIENGRFDLPASRGPGAGEYVVTVVTGRPTGKTMGNRAAMQAKQAEAAASVTVEFTRSIADTDESLTLVTDEGDPM